MTKKKKPKEYSSAQVRAVLTIKDTTGHSIRRIGKDMGIPKSVIGRWIKEEKETKGSYIRKYDFRDTRRKVKSNMSMKDYETFKKMESQILHAPIGRQTELTVEYYDDDDYYSVGYLN